MRTLAAAPLELGLAPSEIERLIAPYVEQRLPADDRRWQAIVEVRERKMRRLRQRRREQGTARTQQDVRSAYGRHWGRSLDELWAPRPFPFEWRKDGLVMASVARRLLNHLLLARALRATGAREVLEVGAGTGFHLFLLGAERPELRLTGAELTASGVAAARQIGAQPVLPDTLARLAPEPLVDLRAHARVRVVQATAAALPFADGAFDAVCTVLALEQMEQIRDAALAELRRVSRRWVIMIEPFADLNAEGLRADYVAANDYFAETIDGLARHGLRPQMVFRDFPNKLTLHVALVIAERC